MVMFHSYVNVYQRVVPLWLPGNSISGKILDKHGTIYPKPVDVGGKKITSILIWDDPTQPITLTSSRRATSLLVDILKCIFMYILRYNYN